MQTYQPGILAEETRLARFLFFSVSDEASVQSALTDLAVMINTEETVVGIGESVIRLLDRSVAGLRCFPAQTAAGIDIPSAPTALWCWLRGNDRGELFHRSRQLEELLVPGFALDAVTDSFQYDANRDLSGYEDGTENPEGDEALRVAIVSGQGQGMDGSSFVAVQQWLHDMDAFQSMTTEEQDDVIGRHVADNEEFDEAPESAHVKRAAQESFDPEAFIVRRSMPWAEGMNGGLMFVAFGRSFDAYEAILNRMLGNEDGIVDGLFSFTRPLTGAYFWCPPVKDGRLDLGLLDI